jgi:integrase
MIRRRVRSFQAIVYARLDPLTGSRCGCVSRQPTRLRGTGFSGACARGVDEQRHAKTNETFRVAMVT